MSLIVKESCPWVFDAVQVYSPASLGSSDKTVNFHSIGSVTWFWLCSSLKMFSSLNCQCIEMRRKARSKNGPYFQFWNCISNSETDFPILKLDFHIWNYVFIFDTISNSETVFSILKLHFQFWKLCFQFRNCIFNSESEFLIFF